MLIKVCQHMHDAKKGKKNQYLIEASNAKVMSTRRQEDQNRQIRS